MKIIFTIFCLFSTGSVIAQAHDAPTPIEELRGDGIVTSVVLVPKDKFTDSELKKYSFEYLSRYHGFKLIQVGFYTEAKTAWDFRGKSIDHFSYEHWKKEYQKKVSAGPNREAILLAYGSSASLRIRDPNQNVRQVLVVGDNVFHLIQDGLDLSVLHVGFSEQGQPSKLTAHFYVATAKRITPPEAERIAKLFFEKIDVRNVDLNLREDEWFIFDTFYPWMNPFTRPQPAPTLKEVSRSVQFLCTPVQEEACFQSALGNNK